MWGSTHVYAAERQQLIHQLLQDEKRCSVNELAERFGVSKATVRSDLSAMDSEGLLIRTHGGAILREGDTAAPSLPDRKSYEDALSERAFEREKERIAGVAVSLVANGDILLVDSGTTSLAFARELARSPLQDLTVYTNDLCVLMALEENPAISANVLPGKIRSGFHYAYGDDTIAALQDAHFSKLILTASAIDVENGLTVVKPHLSNLKKAMLHAGNMVILIADSSKVGETRFQRFANLSDIDIMVTDTGLSADDQAALRSCIGELIVC